MLALRFWYPRRRGPFVCSRDPTGGRPSVRASRPNPGRGLRRRFQLPNRLLDILLVDGGLASHPRVGAGFSLFGGRFSFYALVFQPVLPSLQSVLFIVFHCLGLHDCGLRFYGVRRLYLQLCGPQDLSLRHQLLGLWFLLVVLGAGVGVLLIPSGASRCREPVELTIAEDFLAQVSHFGLRLVVAGDESASDTRLVLPAGLALWWRIKHFPLNGGSLYVVGVNLSLVGFGGFAGDADVGQFLLVFFGDGVEWRRVDLLARPLPPQTPHLFVLFGFPPRDAVVLRFRLHVCK